MSTTTSREGLFINYLHAQSLRFQFGNETVGHVYGRESYSVPGERKEPQLGLRYDRDAVALSPTVRTAYFVQIVCPAGK